MPLQQGEVTADMVSVVLLQFWKDDMVSPLEGEEGAAVLTHCLASPCMKGQGLPLLPSLADGCQALKELRLLKLSLLLSMLFLSPDPDASP